LTFPERFGLREGAFFDIFARGMLFANGDVHRRHRAPFSRAFAFGAISVMRPGIRRNAAQLVDEAAQQLKRHVADTLDGRRRKPREDFHSTFPAAANAAGEMCPDEIIIQILLLIVAGTDSTGVAIRPRLRRPCGSSPASHRLAALRRRTSRPKELFSLKVHT
jgi:cytochrome P450